ncbi:MAG: helix-turn-helix transcriptional regulator [bacterium]|nr:helix-turn-helix transcriptional regulator [bacterium]
MAGDSLPFSGRPLAQVVKSARERKNMTQAGLARRCNTAQIAISKIEADEGAPKLELTRRIAKLLGLNESELLRLAKRTHDMQIHKTFVKALSEKPVKGELEGFAALMELPRDIRQRIIASAIHKDYRAKLEIVKK